MFELTLKISPLIIAFIVGLVLQRYQLLTRTHADIMLRIVINVGLPILILISISNIELNAELGLISSAAGLTILCTWPFVVFTGRLLRLPRPTLGVFIIGPMIMNMAIVYPFVIIAWGTEGFAYLALFDFGNGLLVLTLVYTLSCWYGAGSSHWQYVLKGMFTFPPFLALFAALALNFAGLSLPTVIIDSLQTLGRIILLLVPVALGIYLDTRMLFSLASLSAVVLRTGLGLLFGLLWIELFDFEGIMRAVILIGSVAPVGFNCLVFASQQKLDKGFAASIASLSLIMSLIYLPVLLFILE